MTYYNEIRNDIAKDFGLEAAGYAPRPKYELPIVIAKRINDKYPPIWEEGALRPTLNPMAIRIAKKYVSLMKVGSN